MRTPRSVRHFTLLEDGLVSVEWIALVAGMVVAAVAITFIITQNTSENGGPVSSTVEQPSTSTTGVP